MRRLTISFTEENYQKIFAMAQKEDISISKCLNTCIENVALRNEATKRNAEASLSPMEKMLWKKILVWVLESRYLVRSLVEKGECRGDNEGTASLLDIAKTKAEANILALLENLENAR